MNVGSLTSTLSTPASQPLEATRERWLRRILIGFLAIGALVVLANCCVLLWGQNEFTQPESVVAAQSMMLAHDGTFYTSLRGYPYTVNAYMPVFYLLDAGLIRLGAPAFVAGRFISFAALLGIYAICWRVLKLVGKSPYCAWLGTALCVWTSVLLAWGTVGQVDTLAIFFALTAFHQYLRRALLAASVFAVLALFTKQTALAAPAAIFLGLLFERPRLANWKTALAFGSGAFGFVLAAAFALNLATHGGFFANTLFANINPFAWEKLSQHVNYIAIAAGQLILVTAICVRAMWRSQSKMLLVYLGFAAAIFLLTAPKIGSDSNYQIETTVLLVLCASAGADALGFFDHVLHTSRSLIPFLQVPLALHMVLNVRISVPFLIARVVKEQMFRQQVAELKPLVPTSGRIVSTELNAMVNLRGRLDVEPLIYTLLVKAGRIDPMLLQGDLASASIPAVILYQDVNKPFDNDPELPTLPPSQLDEIRKHYKLTRHVPGPYLDGVFVYEPRSAHTGEGKAL